MTTPATLTGPRTALDRYIRDAENAADRWQPITDAIRAHHRDQGTSGQSVYHLTGDPAAWRYVGPVEDHRDVLGQTGYVAVGGRYGANRYTIADHPHHGRAVVLRAKSTEVAPIVSAALALCLRAGLLIWDTGETVNAAGRRIAAEGAWTLLHDPNPATAERVFAAALTVAGVADHAMTEYARAYLAQRDIINPTLDRLGVEWGGHRLDAAEAAERAGISPSTWRAYVTRDQAPGPDWFGPSRWRAATVDSWRLTRPGGTSGR